MAQILGLLARTETPERDSSLFVLSQLMVWFLAATDGHAKNFSIFLRRGGYGLTPFYDLLSAWPVIGNKPRQLQPQKVRMAMAMRTGTRPHYKWDEIAGWYSRIAPAVIAINIVFAIGLVHVPELFTLGGSGGWALELQGMFLFTLALLVPGTFSINRR